MPATRPTDRTIATGRDATLAGARSASDRARGRGPARLARWLAILVVAWTLVVPVGVLAQEIPRLDGQITDLTSDQVLASGRSRIETALDDLLEAHNIQLFVLFVETTGDLTVTEFADEVARQNSLGGNDALLLVALSDRTDAIWRGSASLERLTDRELEDVLTRRVDPLLAQGDFAGAVVAAADGIGDVAGEGEAQGERPPVGGVIAVLVGIVVIVGGIFLWLGVSSWRRQRRAAEERERQTEKLAQEANTLLIRTDEALRDAEEEIGFAEAQFGEAEVVSYRDALKQASEELKAAFSLRQDLDDAEPEDPDTRLRMVEEIIERARRAETLLDEQRKRIEALRDLERTAPEVLAALPSQIEAVAARIPEAERTLAGLNRYAEQSLASVQGNLEAVDDRLAQARGALEEGERALAAGDRMAAGRSAQAAQQALAEATRLLDGIDSLAASLRQAEAAAGQQFAAATADVRAARQALSGRGMTDLDRRLTEAEEALKQAERDLSAERPDVLNAVRLIAQADSTADQILAEVRQEEERRARERQVLISQLQASEISYSRASDFIAARRRFIDSTARTRLAEAGRHLERARELVDSDPRTALAEARRAQDLAEDAYALAREDVDQYFGYEGWGGFPRGPAVPILIPFPMGGRRSRSGRSSGGRSFGGRFGGRSVGSGWGGGRGGKSVGGRW